MADIRIELMTGIFKDDSLSSDKFQCLYYAYNTTHTAFVAKKSRFDTFANADSNLTTFNATFLSNLANDFDNVTVNSNSVLFTGTDYIFYKLDITISSSSADIDYTQVLTDINTNLTNLNTNITNKNNQSDIVQVIKDCFIERVGARDLSVFKTGSNDDSVKGNAFIPVLLFKLAQLLSSDSNYSYNSTNLIANRALDNISKKLSLENPTDSTIGNTSIRRLLFYFLNIFLKSQSQSTEEVRANSIIKDISDKLANSNDLHTISQAIDLISTAIAQTNNTLTNTNTDLGNIATNINSIQSNPLIEVNIDVPYEVKNLTKKDTEY